MDPLRKVSLAEKFALFDDAWNPRVVGGWDGQQVRLAKMRGEFIWHHHEHEDEVFFVVRGALRMFLRDPDERDILLQEGELLIVPRGVEHKPAAEGEEAWVMLLESVGTLNTGNTRGERSRDILERI